MLKTNFIKPKLNIDFFGKTRFWVGLFLGLGLAFSLFGFFSFFKLAMQHITYMDWAGYSIAPPKETLFYQFIFAFIALLMGQHFFFEFLFFKPREFRGKKIRKNTILHNSRFSSWTILFVGFKWILSIGLLSFIQLTPLFGYFTLGWWASILLIIWWHFFTWQEITKIFINGKWWSLISFIGIICLSFIYIQFIPNIYADLYQKRAEQLSHYKLKIDLPTTSHKASTKLIHQSLVQTFFVGDPTGNDSIRISSSWSEEFEIHSLPLIIENFNPRVPKLKRELIISSLAIDKEIKMKHVYKFLKTLGENNRLKISFAALSPEQKYSNLYFETFSKGLLTAIPLQCNNLKSAVELIKKNHKTTLEDLENIYSKPEHFFCDLFFWKFAGTDSIEYDFIKISSQNEFILNGEKIARDNLFEKIKNIVWEKKDKANFVFDVDNEATYEHYFFLRHEHKQAMYEVRNKEALISFGKDYDFLEKINQKKIRSKIPMMIEEFYNDDERFIFNFFRNKKVKN